MSQVLDMFDEVAALVRRFPLPEGATLQDPYVESVDVHGVVIHMVGLAVEYEGECVTGSAGSLAEPPFVRAYMELLERLAIVSLEARAAASNDASSFAVAWRPSRSNGVAAGTTREDAARRACLELVERDRVLRSWYGGTPPRRTDLGPLVPAALLESYGFEAYLFEEAHGVQTAAVFGFPRRGAPLVYGFAARDSVAEATSAAFDECLQRLGFLWGEPVPEASPAPAPTPSFHQEHYLCPANHESLRRWLRGEHALLFAGRFLPGELSGWPTVEAVRPAWLSPQLHVARALPRGHVPLGFGAIHPFLTKPLASVTTPVHPIP